MKLRTRVRPIYEKLSDQVPNGGKVRYGPKGHLGEILTNLGENCNGAEQRNFTN